MPAAPVLHCVAHYACSTTAALWSAPRLVSVNPLMAVRRCATVCWCWYDGVLSSGRGRREAMDRARQHAESGNMTAANECYQKAVDIAPWMAKVVIEVCGGQWHSRCWD